MRVNFPFFMLIIAQFMLSFARKPANSFINAYKQLQMLIHE
jgi:hypothetical protein